MLSPYTGICCLSLKYHPNPMLVMLMNAVNTAVLSSTSIPSVNVPSNANNTSIHLSTILLLSHPDITFMVALYSL